MANHLAEVALDLTTIEAVRTAYAGLTREAFEGWLRTAFPSPTVSRETGGPGLETDTPPATPVETEGAARAAVSSALAALRTEASSGVSVPAILRGLRCLAHEGGATYEICTWAADALERINTDAEAYADELADVERTVESAGATDTLPDDDEHTPMPLVARVEWVASDRDRLLRDLTHIATLDPESPSMERWRDVIATARKAVDWDDSTGVSRETVARSEQLGLHGLKSLRAEFNKRWHDKAGSVSIPRAMAYAVAVELAAWEEFVAASEGEACDEVTKRQRLRHALAAVTDYGWTAGSKLSFCANVGTPADAKRLGDALGIAVPLTGEPL